MKTIITALAATLALGAQSISAEEKTKYDHCEDLGETGYTIMRMHQEGIPRSTALDIAGRSDLVRTMIAMAYDEPTHITHKDRKKAQAEFQDTVYTQCLEYWDGD